MYVIFALCAISIMYPILESTIICLPPPIPMLKFLLGPNLSNISDDRIYLHTFSINKTAKNEEPISEKNIPMV